jgi:pilus assembly protein CpaE
VLVGIRDLAFHQEVLDWLERDPRLEVVGAASEPERLVQLISDTPADAWVICPSAARQLRHPAIRHQLPKVVLVAQEMTVPVLREAIELGTHGVFAWPEERDDLSDLIARSTRQGSETESGRGRVLAVVGARGGAGTTFLASNLAATFAVEGLRCVVVDMDHGFADLTVALGVPLEDPPRTVSDLVPVTDELSPEHVEDALYQHSAGFFALLAPQEPGEVSAVPPGLYAGAVALLAGSFDVVILHVPRAIEEVARLAVMLADDVLLVANQDLFSLFGARRIVAALGLGQGAKSCRLIVNKLAKHEVTSADLARVLGMTPLAGIRFDPAVKRAQDRGELITVRSRRAGHDLRRLAHLLAVDHAVIGAKGGS